MNQNIFPLDAVNLQVLVNVPNLEVTTLEFCVGLEYLFIQRERERDREQSEGGKLNRATRNRLDPVSSASDAEPCCY
jgi:hypothetical protein